MRAPVASMSAQMTRMRARVRSHPRLAVVALVVLCGMLTALGLRQVAHRREVVRLGYELSTATAELRRLDEEARRLRLEKSVLTNPARIEHLAVGLGMVRPAPEQIRVVWRQPASLLPAAPLPAAPASPLSSPPSASPLPASPLSSPPSAAPLPASPRAEAP